MPATGARKKRIARRKRAARKKKSQAAAAMAPMPKGVRWLRDEMYVRYDNILDHHSVALEGVNGVRVNWYFSMVDIHKLFPNDSAVVDNLLASLGAANMSSLVAAIRGRIKMLAKVMDVTYELLDKNIYWESYLAYERIGGEVWVSVEILSLLARISMFANRGFGSVSPLVLSMALERPATSGPPPVATMFAKRFIDYFNLCMDRGGRVEFDGVMFRWAHAMVAIGGG